MDAPMNRSVAQAIASLFGTERDSDCTVLFCLEEGSPLPVGQEVPTSEEGEQPTKRQRTADDVGASRVGGHGSLGEPLPGHTLVLKYASERFAAQIERWESSGAASTSDTPPATRGGDGGCKRRAAAAPVLRVPLGSEEEIPAARAAIGHAYTGRVEASSIREALLVRRQAGYLQIEGCVDVCDELLLAELAKVTAASSSPAAGTSSGGGTNSRSGGSALELFGCAALFPCAEDAGFAAVLKAAKPQLVAHFPNTLAVLNTPALRQQLFALPAAGLEALLGSEEFGTDSESSVLLLLATWMQDNYGKTDAPTRERLCRLVRLTQLTRPYTAFILPGLALDYTTKAVAPAGWLPVDSMQAADIAHYVSAPVTERTRYIHCMSATAWYDTVPRPQSIPATGVTYPWSISQQDLEQAVIALKPDESCNKFVTFDGGMDSVFAGGFRWRACLSLKHGSATVGVFFHCDKPGCYSVEGSHLNNSSNALIVGADVAFALHHGPPEARVNSTYVLRTPADFVQVRYGWGRRSGVVPLRAAATDGGGGPLAAWADCLRDGKITGTVTLLRPAA